MIDFSPTDEQALVVDTVRQFAEKEIRPVARQCEEAKQLPAEVLGRAHELGLVANALPEAYGGGGERSAVTGALIAEELAWGDLAIALAVLSPGSGRCRLRTSAARRSSARTCPAFWAIALRQARSRSSSRASAATRSGPPRAHGAKAVITCSMARSASCRGSRAART